MKIREPHSGRNEVLRATLCNEVDHKARIVIVSKIWDKVIIDKILPVKKPSFNIEVVMPMAKRCDDYLAVRFEVVSPERVGISVIVVLMIPIWVEGRNQ